MGDTLTEHLGYVADSTRLKRYQAAVEAQLSPGATVADVGCGSAVLGLLCLKAGASHVYAIDETDALNVARRSLALAGWAEQTTFREGRSSQLTLANEVDLIICDHVGYFGIDYGLIDLMSDARRRFLKPGGAMIPGRLKLMLAPVASERLMDLAHAWKGSTVPPEFHWVDELSVNNRYAVDLKTTEVLATPSELVCIDLREDQPEFFSWSTEWTVERDEVLHGVAGWFNCELAEGIWMTNSPLSEDRIDRHQIYLPINDPMPVKAGERICASIMMRPTENLIAWDIQHPASSRRSSHSTWQGNLLGPERLLKLHPEHQPRPSPWAHAFGVVMGYCDGERTRDEVRQLVLKEHSTLFPTTGEIERFVADVLGGHTE